MRIVFGGSFNPPTVAHTYIIKYLSLHFDEVILMPNANKYQKSDLIDFTHRKKMLELVTSAYTNVTISDLENEKGFLGTYHMLRELNHPYFACGEDCLDQFEHWIEPKHLLSENHFLIFSRETSVKQMMQKVKHDSFLNVYKDHFTFVQIDFPQVSSSLFRKTWDEQMVDESVKKYIEEHHLYKE